MGTTQAPDELASGSPTAQIVTAETDQHQPTLSSGVIAFIASGVDPNGYFVSARNLKEVIQAVEEVAQATRDSVITLVECLASGTDLVDSLQLGFRLGALLATSPDSKGVSKIIANIRNLDKVPFVNVRGKEID